MDLLQRVIGSGFPGGAFAAPAPPAAAPASTLTSALTGPAPAPPPLGPDGKPDIAAVLARVQAVTAALPNAGVAKMTREVYVGGLPQGIGITAPQLRDFFNLVIEKAGLLRPGVPGPPVANARMGDSAAFAFLEMRAPEDTDLVVTHLSSVPFVGAVLRLGRPKAYVQQYGNTPAVIVAAQGGAAPAFGGLGAAGAFGGLGTLASAPALAASAPAASVLLGGGSAPTTTASAGQPLTGAAAAALTDVVLLRNLQPFMSADALRDMLTPFGSVRACALVGASAAALPPAPVGAVPDAGAALVAFDTPSVAATVIDGLQGLEIAGRALMLSRAPAGAVTALLGPSFLPAPPPEAQPTRILELSNVVVAEDVTDAEALSEVREDVAEECSKYGRVLSVYVPTLSDAQRAVGQEKVSVPVLVECPAPADAAAIASALRGRKFDGRTVSVRFSDESALAAATGVGASEAGATSTATAAGDDDGDEHRGLGSAAAARGEATSGGSGNHYASASVPPPASYAPSTTGPAAAAAGGGSTYDVSELPEDGLALPTAPSAADLD